MNHSAKKVFCTFILSALCLLVPMNALAVNVSDYMQNQASGTPEASASGQGVTIQVKKTLADAYNVFVLCSITLPENTPFTDDMLWSQQTLTIGSEPAYSTLDQQILAQSGSQSTALYRYRQNDPIPAGQIRFIFGDLVRLQGTSLVPVIPGTWELTWNVEKEPSIDLQPNQSANLNGNSITVKHIAVSPMAVNILAEANGSIANIAPVVQMKNGTAAQYPAAEERTGGQTVYSGSGQTSTLVHSSCYFDHLINVQDVASIKIGDTVIPVSAAANTDKPSSWAAAQVETAVRAGIVPSGLQKNYTNAITRGEFCALATSLYESVTKAEITARQKFSDTSDVNIEKMAALGIVQGVGENRFAPDQTLTREQAAVMLARLSESLDKPLPARSAAFADSTQIAAWAAQAVDQVQEAGLMNGVGNNRFDPQGIYTREQSIVTLLRLYQLVRGA